MTVVSDVSSNAGPPAPDVAPEGITEIASDVFVIPDRRVPLVPNIGIVLGRDAALVIDTGMGPVNGRKVLEVAIRLAAGRRLILTITHFHPEHGFGAQAFKGAAHITYNRAQHDELQAKGQAYLGMFRTFGPGVAEALSETDIVSPDETYDGASSTLDLGGRQVELQDLGTCSHARRPSGMAAGRKDSLRRGPRGRAHLSDFSVVSARRRRP